MPTIEGMRPETPNYDPAVTAAMAVQGFVLTGEVDPELLSAVQQFSQNGESWMTERVVRIGCQQAMDDPGYKGNDEALARLREIHSAFIPKPKPAPVARAVEVIPIEDRIIDPDSESWQDFANCLGVDGDLFFPERGASTREAKEICRGCVVREECLEYALATNEKHGIWGGMSERERRRVRRQRALARTAATAF